MDVLKTKSAQSSMVQGNQFIEVLESSPGGAIERITAPIAGLIVTASQALTGAAVVALISIGDLPLGDEHAPDPTEYYRTAPSVGTEDIVVATGDAPQVSDDVRRYVTRGGRMYDPSFAYAASLSDEEWECRAQRRAILIKIHLKGTLTSEDAAELARLEDELLARQALLLPSQEIPPQILACLAKFDVHL